MLPKSQQFRGSRHQAGHQLTARLTPIKMSLSTKHNLACHVIAVVECDNENQIEPIEEQK